MSAQLDWSSLRNPVLKYDDLCIKDACWIERRGVHYLFFSAFDHVRCRVTGVKTTDFRTFSQFLFAFEGPPMGEVGFCSPDVQEIDGRYYLAFNAWGSPNNRPFYSVSDDLEHWSPARPLAQNLFVKRTIDATLARSGATWYCMARGCWKPDAPRVAMAPGLDGPWNWVAQPEGIASLLLEGNTDSGLQKENFEFVRLGDRLCLVTSEYSPRRIFLYEMDGPENQPASWLRWTRGRRLLPPQEQWNTLERDNAPAICLRSSEGATDGWHHMVYAGKTEERSDDFGPSACDNPWPRGWCKLGIARSRDLQSWEAPGPG